jgi:hypothetical protein
MDDRRREWILLATRPSGGRFTTTAKGNRLCATREPAPESGKVVDNNHLIVRRPPVQSSGDAIYRSLDGDKGERAAAPGETR